MVLYKNKYSSVFISNLKVIAVKKNVGNKYHLETLEGDTVKVRNRQSSSIM